MFEQTFIPRAKTHKTWTVLAALLGELVLVGIAVLIPMMWVQALPKEQLMSYLVAPPLPPPPTPPPPPPAHLPKPAKVTRQRVHSERLFAPRFIPKRVLIPKAQEELPAPEVAGVVGGIPGGAPGGQLGGVIGGIIGSVGKAVAPPPSAKKAPPNKPTVPQRLRVGGNVQEALLIHKVMPAYPTLAKAARIQGVVRLDAIIDKNGKVQSLTVIKGPPLLAPAAIQAVKQWAYKPTLLNGLPVEIATEIDVRFALG